MSRFHFFAGKFILILCSVIIGIPVGIFMGLLYFIRVSFLFPIQMYESAHKEWLKKVKLQQADIWTRHIARMEKKQKDN